MNNKKTMILCTIAICCAIFATGYFIASACGNGAMSAPHYYLNYWYEKAIVVGLAGAVVISLLLAVLDVKKNGDN